ncbi:MAG: hypothetical protein ABI577_04620 [bacterium]
MLQSFAPQRARVTAALLVLLAGIALLTMAARSTPAQARQEDYGSDVQGQVIAGSRLRVVVFDDGDHQAWAGKVNGPNGTVLDWSAQPSNGDWITVLYKQDLEGGAYTVVPATPVAPGWHVAGYLAQANIDPATSCHTNGQFHASDFNNTSSVNLTVQDHSWVICVGVVRDGGIWGSNVAARFVSSGPAGNWLGGLSGPQGLYSSFESMIGANYAGTIHNTLPGLWTAYPGNPPQSGMTVVGYHVLETTKTFFDCPSEPSLYTSSANSVTVSAQHPSWAICIKIVPSVPDSTLWVQVVGSGAILPWSGKVTGPNSFQRSFLDMALGIGGNSSLLENLAPGTWTVAPAVVPAVGYTVLGFYITDGGSQTLCPASEASYSSQNSFQINDQHPNKYVCILMSHPTLVQGSMLALSVVAAGGQPSADWTGAIDGPGTFDWTWKAFGISGPNFASNQYNLGAGNYTFTGGTPVRPGWEVKGFAEVEVPNQPFPTCPASFAAYGPDNVVTISDQHPRGAMCVWIEKVSAVQPPSQPDGPIPNLPDDPGIYLPSTTPTTVPTSTPTTIPTSTPTVAQSGGATPTATPSPSRPVDESNTNGPSVTTHTAGDAPLPPNTGTGSGGGGQNELTLVLGLLLIGASALIVAASQRPRTKR